MSRKEITTTQAKEWYESLTDLEKGQVLEGYNKLLALPLIRPSYDSFIRNCYRVSKHIDDRRIRKTFRAVEKVGNIIINGKESIKNITPNEDKDESPK